MRVEMTITWRRVVAAVVAAAVLALAAFGAIDLLRTDESLGDMIDKGKFQAVVLTSGVVYFGHLRASGDSFYELRDAYFIQETKDAKGQAARRVVPLTQELHGPENWMLIPRGEVVSIENLRSDSPVAKAASGR